MYFCCLCFFATVFQTYLKSLYSTVISSCCQWHVRCYQHICDETKYLREKCIDLAPLYWCFDYFFIWPSHVTSPTPVHTLTDPCDEAWGLTGAMKSRTQESAHTDGILNTLCTGVCLVVFTLWGRHLVANCWKYPEGTTVVGCFSFFTLHGKYFRLLLSVK